MSHLLSSLRTAAQTATRRSAQIGRAATQQQTRRTFASGGHGHGVEYKGLTLTPPKPWQYYGAHFFGGLMYFWILYRFKQDYKFFLGLEHPWDAHAHHEQVQHGEAGAEGDEAAEEH